MNCGCGTACLRDLPYLMKKSEHGATYWGLSSHNPSELKHVFRWSREKYPRIQVSCEASAGVEGYTCRRPGASLSLSSFCLSFSVQLDMWEPHNPPPSLRLPDPGQFCQAMRGHLWEFIPDASCSLNPLLFLHLSSLSLSLSLSHQAPPSKLHIYMSLLSVP